MCFFILSGLLVILMTCQIRFQANPASATSAATIKALILLEELLKYTPHLGLIDRTIINPPNTQKEEARSTARPYLFSCAFYDIEDAIPIPEDAQAPSKSIIPFTTSFESLFLLSIKVSRVLSDPSVNVPAAREVLSRILTLAERLLARLTISINVTWDPAAWMTALLQTFEYEVRSYQSAV